MRELTLVPSHRRGNAGADGDGGWMEGMGSMGKNIGSGFQNGLDGIGTEFPRSILHIT